MYNDTRFKLDDNPEYQDVIDEINEALNERHERKNTFNVLCTIEEYYNEVANGDPVFDHFEVHVRHIEYNKYDEKMWGFLGDIKFSLKAAKEFIPAVYEYCTNNYIIYIAEYLRRDLHNKNPYVQFLFQKAQKEYEELKQLAEVLSI